MSPKAFIIHGHDVDAFSELSRFVTAVGIEVVLFHRSSSDDGLGTILGKVLNGITSADVVIVLFTPDEQANYHDPRTGEYRAKSSANEDLGGWQPRPNVVFEAGVAVGMAQRKTILVKLGPVRTMSDLAGVLFVDLDEPNAKEQLYEALRQRVEGLSLAPGVFPGGLPGDFAKCRRGRWEYHDEIGELENSLRELRLEGFRETLLGALDSYVATYPIASTWNSTDIADFVLEHYTRGTYANDYANGAFWNLMIHGVFAFRYIDDGWDDPQKELWWVDMQEHVHLTARGRALLSKLRSL